SFGVDQQLAHRIVGVRLRCEGRTVVQSPSGIESSRGLHNRMRGDKKLPSRLTRSVLSFSVDLLVATEEVDGVVVFVGGGEVESCVALLASGSVGVEVDA